jgi:hypothetical protein
MITKKTQRFYRNLQGKIEDNNLVDMSFNKLRVKRRRKGQWCKSGKGGTKRLPTPLLSQVIQEERK